MLFLVALCLLAYLLARRPIHSFLGIETLPVIGLVGVTLVVFFQLGMLA